MRTIHRTTAWVRWCACLGMALVPLAAMAAASGFDFTNKDWEVACDNTRTCRAAGYQAESDVNAVSVLLTRAAGPGTAVQGKVQLGSYSDEDRARIAKLPDPMQLALWIDGKPAGTLMLGKKTLVAPLPASLLTPLLAALRRDAMIEWKSGSYVWKLSGQGAMAVLLKMDEAQGRLGTPDALVRKGAHAGSSVLPPLPPPLVLAVTLPKTAAATAPAPGAAQALRAALAKSLGENDNCDSLAGKDGDGPAALGTWPLSSTQRLVQATCWQAAYNEGIGYWVVGNAPGAQAVLVTDSGSGYDGAGTLHSEQKGRGLGDCWSSDAWTWDGKAFVHTASGGTGMCRMVAPGGAWRLPTLVSEVRRQPR